MIVMMTTLLSIRKVQKKTLHC